jgi:CRISPR system Cascade subunit CasB
MTTEAEARFIAYLRGLHTRDDRATLAALRRGLGKPAGTAIEMFPYVIPHAPDRYQDAYFLIAALFALYPDASDLDENLGASFRLLSDDASSDGVQRRFVALLRADLDEMPAHLRHAIALLKAHQIPVSWERLLPDLAHWGHPNGYVQRNWGYAFWAATS